LGGNEHPSQQSLPLLKLFLISVFAYIVFEIYMLSHIFLDCGIVNVSCEGIVCAIMVIME
jgi:hypothetical protein